MNNIQHYFRFGRSAHRTACAVTFALALISFAGSVRSAEVLDGVAAVVNGDVITFSQVREVVSARERALRAQYSGQDLVNKIKEARLGALKDLIDRQLILQEFRKKEFTVPPRVIDERVQQVIREDFGGDRQAFVRTLQSQGYTMTRFRELERDKFIVQAMRFTNVKNDLLVSPHKVQDYYSTSRNEFTSQDQVHLRMIKFGATGGTASASDAQRALADDVRAKLLTGASFEQMAAKYSEDTSRQNGGDWGWLDHNTLNPEITKLIFSLPTKQLSPVIVAGDAYYILRIDERREAGTKPLKEIRPDIERKMISEDKNRMTQQWLDGLRQKAYIRMY
jgi:peptidyl-prolyl cis-trans isomerase SurA